LLDLHNSKIPEFTLGEGNKLTKKVRGKAKKSARSTGKFNTIDERDQSTKIVVESFHFLSKVETNKTAFRDTPDFFGRKIKKRTE
jgi:hypothetical protein